MSDANYLPLSGEFIKAKVQITNYPDGTCTGATISPAIFEIDVDSWNLNRNGNTRFVPNGKRGIYRIRGPRDWSGTCTVIWNRAEMLNDIAKAAIIEGSIGTIYLWTDCSDDVADAYSFEAIIDSVGDAISFGGELRQNIAFSLRDGSTIHYPEY